MGRKKLPVSKENMENFVEKPKDEKVPEISAGEPETEKDPKAPASESEAEKDPKVPAEDREVAESLKIPAREMEVEKVPEDAGELGAEKDPEVPAEDQEAAESLKIPAKEMEAEKKLGMLQRKTYRVVCCNLINETFGGVSFHNGVAYTDDSFTASWFRNKEGYTVEKE